MAAVGFVSEDDCETDGRLRLIDDSCESDVVAVALMLSLIDARDTDPLSVSHAVMDSTAVNVGVGDAESELVAVASFDDDDVGEASEGVMVPREVDVVRDEDDVVDGVGPDWLRVNDGVGVGVGVRVGVPVFVLVRVRDMEPDSESDTLRVSSAVGDGVSMTVRDAETESDVVHMPEELFVGDGFVSDSLSVTLTTGDAVTIGDSDSEAVLV
jgi:hypothetical protein